MSKIWILFAALAVVVVLSIYFSSVSYAATSENSEITSSLTVATFVDTSLDTSTLSFGSLNPNTLDNAATENPLTLTNTVFSNIAVDIYLNNTNMTYTSYFINATNLSVATTNLGDKTQATNFTGTAYLNGATVNTGFVENLAVGGTQTLYFWHDVPAGQYAGAYTSAVRIHSVASDGTTAP